MERLVRQVGAMDRGGGILNGEVAVLQLPGSNCEAETARAVRHCGGRAEIVRWNVPRERLVEYSGYIIPGGFSYQDRIRGGAIGARLPVMGTIVERAREGAPVLGICNGAQVLVEAGLVPEIGERSLDVVLGPNRMPGREGYYTRWVVLGAGPAASRCLFTHALGEVKIQIPMAHAEGRFMTRDPGVAARFGSHVALTYREPAGRPADSFPWNPNGSLEAAAGITNRQGNVLAMMPHPERAILRAQVPEDLSGNLPDDPESDGPGCLLFRALVGNLEDR